MITEAVEVPGCIKLYGREVGVQDFGFEVCAWRPHFPLLDVPVNIKSNIQNRALNGIYFVSQAGLRGLGRVLVLGSKGVVL